MKKLESKIKFKSRKEIANEYGVDRKTLYRWIKKANIELPKRYLSPKEQEFLYNKLGYPKKNNDQVKPD